MLEELLGGGLLIHSEWHTQVFFFDEGRLLLFSCEGPLWAFCPSLGGWLLGYFNGCHIINHVRRSWIIQFILIEFKKCLVGLYWVPLRDISRVSISLSGTEPSLFPQRKRDIMERHHNVTSSKEQLFSCEKIFFKTWKHVYSFWGLNKGKYAAFEGQSKHVKTCSLLLIYLRWNKEAYPTNISTACWEMSAYSLENKTWASISHLMFKTCVCYYLTRFNRIM